MLPLRNWIIKKLKLDFWVEIGLFYQELVQEIYKRNLFYQDIESDLKSLCCEW